jgi:hypothetical protein
VCCLEYLYRRYRFIGAIVNFFYTATGSLQRLQPPDSARKSHSSESGYDVGRFYRCLRPIKIAPLHKTDTVDKSQLNSKPKPVPILGRFLSSSMQNNCDSRQLYLVGNSDNPAIDSRDVDTGGPERSYADSLEVHDRSKNTEDRLHSYHLSRVGSSSCEVMFDSEDVCHQLSEDAMMECQPALLAVYAVS